MDADRHAAGPAFGLLGPVAAWNDATPVALGGTKVRALLAVLLMHRDRVVSVPQVVEALWGEAPPRSAAKMVQVLVSRLRRALGPDLAPVVRTVDGGYRLDLPPEAIDVFRGRALCAEGRRMLPTRPDLAGEHFRAALDLWRGEPLCDVLDEPFATAVIAELDELRDELLDGRVAADLALGRHGELVGELRGRAAAHPGRESVQADLMLALYRSGRQSDALDVARRAKTRLVEDFGLDAGHEIESMEQRILQRDPSLTLPTPSRSSIVLPPRVSTPRVSTPPTDDDVTAGPPSVYRSGSSTRRKRVVLLGALLVTAAAVATIAAVTNEPQHVTPPAPTHALTANSVVVLDAVSGAVRADVPVGRFPGSVVLARGSSWVCDRADKTLTRIDSSSFVTQDVVGLTQSPQFAASTGGQLWVGLGLSGEVARIDAASNQITSAFYPAHAVGGFLDLAGSASGVWIGTSDAQLVRLNPGSAVAAVRVSLPARSDDVVASGSQAWTVTAGGAVFRVAPGAGAARLASLPDPPAGIAYGYGSVWVATTGDVLYRLAPRTGHITGRYRLQAAPTSIAVGAGAVWVAENPRGVLERIPISAGAPRATFDLGYPVGGLALSGTSLWVALDHR